MMQIEDISEMNDFKKWMLASVQTDKELTRSYSKHVRELVNSYDRGNLSEEWLRWFLMQLTSSYVNRKITNQIEHSLTKVLNF